MALGPDPLRSDGELLSFKNDYTVNVRQLVQSLLDQRVIAGLGNIYRAELFFHHRLDPRAPSSTLSGETVQALWETSVWWLQLGVRANRIITTLTEPPKRLPRMKWRESLQIYGKRRCPSCGHTVEPITLGQRKLYWCVQCQTKRT